MAETHLAKARKKADLRLVDVHKKTGITAATLSRYENGIRIPRQSQAHILYKFYKSVPGVKLKLIQIYEPY